MISKIKFLEYQLEIERRLSKQHEEIALLKLEMQMQELRHKFELKEFAKEKQTVTEISDEEKAAAELERKQASTLLAYTEDRETLEKLGFKFGGDSR